MVETHRFFRFSLYGGDSPAFLGFHFMVETHLRQFLVYNKYMQFALKNQYNSIILQNINSIILPKYKPPKTKVLRGWKFFLKLYVPKRMINVLVTGKAWFYWILGMWCCKHVTNAGLLITPQYTSKLPK